MTRLILDRASVYSAIAEGEESTFANAVLLGVNLQGFVFDNTYDFTSSVFIGCDLRGVRVDGARLAGAWFVDCDLRVASLVLGEHDSVNLVGCTARQPDWNGHLDIASYCISDSGGAWGEAIDTSVRNVLLQARFWVHCNPLVMSESGWRFMDERSNDVYLFHQWAARDLAERSQVGGDDDDAGGTDAELGAPYRVLLEGGASDERIQASEGGDISGTVLAGATLDHFSLESYQMRDSVFLDCHFSIVSFDGSDLRGAWFVACNFNRTTFGGCQMEDTVFYRCQMSVERHASVISRGARCVECTDLDGGTFGTQWRVERGDYDLGTADYWLNNTVPVIARTLPGGARSSMARANSRSVLRGDDLSEAFVDTDGGDVSQRIIDGAQLDDTTMRDYQIRDAVFIDSSLTGTDWQASNLGGAWFVGCDLSDADFSECVFDDTVFAYCRIPINLYDNMQEAGDESAAFVGCTDTDGDTLPSTRALAADDVDRLRSLTFWRNGGRPALVPVVGVADAGGAATSATARAIDNGQALRDDGLYNLTFGMELETCVKVDTVREYRLRVGSYHHGASIPGHMFYEGCEWRTQSDSSINISDSDTTGIEWTSPGYAITGDAVQDVLRFVARLRELGATYNSSCGLHVHVGVGNVFQNLSYNDVVEVCRRASLLMSRWEWVLLAIGGQRSRIDNHFCLSVKRRAGWKGLTKKALKRKQAALQEARATGRYQALNLINLFDGTGARTFEFRLFPATLNPHKVVACILAAVAVIEGAVSDTMNGVTDLDTSPEPFDLQGEYDAFVGFVRSLPLAGSLWREYGARLDRACRWNIARFMAARRTVAAMSGDEE